MAVLQTGPQYGVVYKLTGPSGAVAVFNDSTDPNYVGMLSDITGLDSPDVRESAEDRVETDGGVHGNFYHGRRPITLSGLVYGHSSAAIRNERTTRLMQASNAMLDDATLVWTPDGGIEQYVSVRRQQPTRITGSWNKDFQLAFVAEDPRIYSTTIHTMSALASDPGGVSGFSFNLGFDINFGAANVTGQVLATNSGNYSTPPVITVAGPITNPQFYNATTGDYLYLTYTLAAGETMVVDFSEKTVLLNGTTSRYSAVDFVNSEWWYLVPGVNDIRLRSTTAGSPSAITVAWRDAWL